MHIVLIILEAKPEKQLELQQALTQVVRPSREEKTCLEYRLHQDQTNPNQFVLYEIWESKEAHQQQFNKPYILELAKQLDGLLVKPYQAYFVNELK